MGEIIDLTIIKQKHQRSECGHRSFIINTQEGTVECQECGAIISAFHALLTIARNETKISGKFKYAQQKIDEYNNYTPWLVAVKELERVWRTRNMLPQCPHCSKPIEAEDLAKTANINKKYYADISKLKEIL